MKVAVTMVITVTMIVILTAVIIWALYAVSLELSKLDCQWIQWRSEGGDPPGAVIAGRDTNSDGLVYVGRARFNGDLTIGQFCPGSGMFLSWEALGHRASSFEVLLGRGFYWSKEYQNGYVPQNAVAAGRTKRGDVLYVGRQRINGIFYPGPIVTCDEAIFIAIGEKSYKFANYEVLVNDKHSCQRG